MRRLIHVLAASVLAELAIDLAVGAGAEWAAPRVGEWVFIPAAIVIFGTLPLLVANVIRVIRAERARTRDGRSREAGRWEFDESRIGGTPTRTPEQTGSHSRP